MASDNSGGNEVGASKPLHDLVRENKHPLSYTDTGIQTSTDSEIAPDSVTSP